MTGRRRCQDHSFLQTATRPTPTVKGRWVYQITGLDTLVLEGTYYEDVRSWAAGWFVPTFVDTDVMEWCPKWWVHPEAMLRMEVLWRTWELLRLEPQFGIATWLRVHLDPHLAALTAADGPFHACGGDYHNPGAAPDTQAGRMAAEAHDQAGARTPPGRRFFGRDPGQRRDRRA